MLGDITNRRNEHVARRGSDMLDENCVLGVLEKKNRTSRWVLNINATIDLKPGQKADIFVSFTIPSCCRMYVHYTLPGVQITTHKHKHVAGGIVVRIRNVGTNTLTLHDGVDILVATMPVNIRYIR